jgi:glutamate/tyrosine decarboxylase-like PLP-dependent enzyme
MTLLTDHIVSENTLDPKDWPALRALGHRMLDDMFDHLQTLREQPAWQPVPEVIRHSLREAIPRKGSSEEEVYQEFKTNILPYTNGNRHPHAWGWVRGTGTPLGMLADMLASGMNAHMAGGAQAPVLVEEQTLAWLAEMMGMPRETTGLLTSGGSMANLLGLAVGRHVRAGFDVRRDGLHAGGPELVVYGSTETHSWAQKAVELLGLGERGYRRIPVDAAYRIDAEELRRQIASDKQQGRRPFAVIANCGTVNTGAVDDLPAIAKLCRDEGLWFHVDGAFGALLQITSRYRHLVRGVELADSIAFDLHKWMYLPFEIGCVLVREPDAQTNAFATRASYLEEAQGGIMAGGLPFADRGFELTRSFKALKLWMSLKAYGVDKHAAMIEQNMQQCEHLEHLIRHHPQLELLTPRFMNIVCFRFVGEDDFLRSENENLNKLNREIVIAIQESGKFVVSGTVLRGSYAVRIANTNHRSRMEDFDALVEEVVRTGEGLLKQ